MTPPTITTAKRIAYDLRAKGVLVLAISNGQFGTASYGMTRSDCDAMRKLNDAIYNAIMDGTIPVPEELQ